MGPLYWCPNVPKESWNHYRQFQTRRERRVGATRSRVEEVSLAERDASRGGSDLPNRVGQVIGWMRKKQSRRKGDAV